MARTITNMHGITFGVGRWKLYIHFPYSKGDKVMMDKDSITGQSFISIHTNRRHYMITHTPDGYWVLYKLKYISYNELEDIRKSYIHGNRYHS